MCKVTIDGMAVEVPEGSTILDAAKLAGVDIPTLCYMAKINEIGSCRACVVEVEGQDGLAGLPATRPCAMACPMRTGDPADAQRCPSPECEDYSRRSSQRMHHVQCAAAPARCKISRNSLRRGGPRARTPCSPAKRGMGTFPLAARRHQMHPLHALRRRYAPRCSTAWRVEMSPAPAS